MPTTPAPASTPTYTEPPIALRVVLPHTVYLHYAETAAETKRPLESVLAMRLETCQDYDAEKPIYFGDHDRQELERLLGRNVFYTQDALLQIRNALSVRVQKVIIALKPTLLQKLKSRCISMPWEKFLEERIIHALEQYVGIR